MIVEAANRHSNHRLRKRWLGGSLALALAAVQLFSPAGALAQDGEAPSETAAGSPADQFDPSAVTATTWYVDGSSGSDNNRCTAAGAPCRTIQAAIDRSASGDTILVAGSANGIAYTFAAPTPCTNGLGANAVACVNDKQLTIRGGYTQGSFASYAPAQNVSIIDGQTRNRGVVAVGFASTTGTVLDIGGFTVRNGYGTGIGKRAGTGSYYGFGGGMLVEFVGAVTLRDMTFESNVAAGGDRQSGEGGAGAGGGASFHTTTATLENVRFTKNVARGGSGGERGGYGHGGALFTFNTTLTGNGLRFEGNVARAGNASSSGVAGDGQRADGQGGGACFSTGSKVTLNRVTVLNNQAIGGNAATYAGGAFGGGLYAEAAAVNINDAHIRGNLAQGGNAANGWMGSGGGIMAFNSTLNVNRALILANTAQGGNGSSGDYGGPNGGGITLSASDVASRFTLVNSVVAGNKAAHGQGAVIGGGGGGMWIQATEATIEHATIAHNQLGDGTGLSGQGVLLYNTGNRAANVTFRHSLITGHSGKAGAAVDVFKGNTATFAGGLFHNNTWNASDSNPAIRPNRGTVNGLNTMGTADPLYTAPGSPEYNYRILANSPARDKAGGSQVQVDAANEPRNGTPDYGAYEAAGEPQGLPEGRVKLFLPRITR